MKNELVVKDNALINASYNLELTEQRLILLSIVRARETSQGITAESKLQIHAGDYMCVYGVDKHAAYKALKESANNLFERQFSFKEQHEDTGKIGVVRSRWVSRIKYVDDLALLEITFSPDVVPLITRLEKQFSSYQLKQVSQLTSKYAIRLYELLIAWRNVGKCSFDLEDFRFKLGIDVGEYKLMHQFKNRVLEPAIQQINDLTDISVKYEQRKKGRVISGFDFRFKIKELEQADPNRKVILSEKQAQFFAHKLAHNNEFASRHSAAGESYADFELRLTKNLKDPENISKYRKELQNLGFVDYL